jgi:hypothetical protein
VILANRVTGQFTTQSSTSIDRLIQYTLDRITAM